MRNDNIAELLVNFYNLKFHGFAYEYIVVAYRMDINLATWQECFDTKYVYNHTALGATLNITLNNLVVIKCFINEIPALAQACFLVRENKLTLFIFLVFNVNLYLVANLQVGIVAEL